MGLPMAVVLQQGKADCGIACLAMLLGKTYLEVYAASISKKYRDPQVQGMDVARLKRTARRLGTKLALRRAWDAETDAGLLTVEKLAPKVDDFLQHLVVLKWGLIFDTDGTVWEPDDYYATLKYRPVSLIVEENTDADV